MWTQFWKFLIFALLQHHTVEGATREEVKSKAGATVNLPCLINQAECGDFHSIKWYKENRRVYVYSPIANFAKAEGELVDRGQLIFEANNATTRLQIEGLKTSDEGEYKCEITFLDITKDCPVVQLVKLTTLAEPKYLNVSTSDGRDISTKIIGPFNEGHELRLVCESGGGKPIPRVTWYNGSSVISGKASSFEEEDGTGTGRNEVRIKLSRGDLGSQFSCQAENEAIDQPLSTSVQVDVNLRPYRTEVIGADSPAEDGSVVSLLCRTQGARPAAVITWFNGSRPFSEQPAGQVALQDDNTYETQSRISFIASRFENGESITCEANNQVLDHYREEPQRASVNLAVLYPPVVNVSPYNITTNETREVMIYCTYEANPTSLTSVRWYRNGQLLDVAANRTRYEGATVTQPSLVIRSVSREDAGLYTCVLENSIGVSDSKSSAVLTVYYKPSVTLRMDPPSPISELERRNVTLFCDLVTGFPETLTRVNWYMDGNLLKELPDCPNEKSQHKSGDDLCDIDPSKLLLEHVSKLFHGNYSCEAANEAGWSDLSQPAELEIFYPPGRAFISKDTEMVVKGQAITLTCSVDEVGRPEASKFIWKRGGHLVNDVTSFNWTIDPVTLETEANISCVAENEVGQGKQDFINIQVIAPPTFIVRLPPYTGAMAEVSNFSLDCQVECSPLCKIIWLKDGLAINEDDERYTIMYGEREPDYAKNDFESIYSTLYFNIDKWPGGKLDRIIDNANYTCQSKSWQMSDYHSNAEGVSSTTYFRVEYPPENIEISESHVSVREGSSPEKILCTAEAYPQANYVWRFNNEVVGTDNLLFFDKGIGRHQAGEYTCVAENRHGSSRIATKFDVLFQPECGISQGEYEGQIMLTCEAKANPAKDVRFAWSKAANSSLALSDFTSDGLQSVLMLDAIEASFGTYFCLANNSIGAGVPCEIQVQGVGLLKAMGGANIIIIVAVIAACVVAILIVIVAVILICRRRKPLEKYTNHQDMEEREKILLSRGHLFGPSLTQNDLTRPTTIQRRPQQQYQLHQHHHRPAAQSKTLLNRGTNYNLNSYEVSPSSFRYYSPSVEYLADVNGQHANKSSPDSGYPGDNGFYENLPFHGMKPQQPHKQGLTVSAVTPLDPSTINVGLPLTTAQIAANGYRYGSNTSSSSGRGSSIQHASLPRHSNATTTAASPLAEMLPTVSGQVSSSSYQHHNLTYNNKKNNFHHDPYHNNYQHHQMHHRNSLYRGPINNLRPAAHTNNSTDYAILKFNNGSNVGKEIDV